jgi:DNA-binding GntR family transcriptional regulator
VPLPRLDAPNLGITPSASEVIAAHLRSAIVAGQFAEDEPVRQDDIARLFNVSKIPVREALKRLEAEGLVIFQRNKGAVVTRLSEPELAQMFEVRILLEDKLLRLAIEHMDEQTFTQAESLCEAFINEHDVGRWAALNWTLHACLYEPAQRPFLLNLLRSIHDKLERYLRLQLSLSEGKQRADHEHRAIIQACRAGDIERAATLLDTHISGVCRSLLEHLPGNRPRPPRTAKP